MKKFDDNFSYLKVLSGGQTTSLQDFGRYGHQDKGVPPSGVINFQNMILANKLVGNDAKDAVLETFISGPIIEVNANEALIALVGGNHSYLEIINKNLKIRSGRSIQLKRGDRIKIILGKDNLISTLAIYGGFKVKDVLGSKSTNPSVKMGGFNGGFLTDNLNLPLNLNDYEGQDRIVLKYEPIKEIAHLRVILGPHLDKFTQNVIEKFLATSWKVTKDINRMGIKLSGDEIDTTSGRDMLSDGNQIGSIQVTLKGEPIILLPDRGTIGGYPKIATIISSDFGLISNLKVGQNLNFKKVSIEDAQTIAKETRERFDGVLSSVTKI